MKASFRFYTLCCVMLSILLCSCGYKLHGTRQYTQNSVLGNGSSTVAITKIEDPSLYPWIYYYLNNEFHAEMNYRGLAKWADNKKSADYLMEIHIHKFDTSESLTDEQDRTLLSSVNVEMEVRIINTHDQTTWSSGMLSYSDYFTQISEEQAIKEILKELVYDAFNAIQNDF